MQRSSKPDRRPSLQVRLPIQPRKVRQMKTPEDGLGRNGPRKPRGTAKNRFERRKKKLGSKLTGAREI